MWHVHKLQLLLEVECLMYMILRLEDVRLLSFLSCLADCKHVPDGVEISV